jgi:pilus assembly protein CpaB
VKRIRPGTVTLAIVAILFGLVTAYSIRRYLSDSGPQGVEVVVAKFNLPRFARLQEANLEVVRMPATKVPEGSIRTVGAAVSRLVETTVAAGQPVLQSSLYPIDGEPVMADKIPPGMRAVTISVNEAAALAGVLLPESNVDVMITANGNHPDFPGNVTATLVRNVKVLATSQQRHRFSENSPRPLRSITLAVTAEQANKLILAQQYANLVSPRELLGLPPARRGLPIKAQIWRGTTMSETTFQPELIDEAEQATVAAENSRQTVPTSIGLIPPRTH